MISVIIPVYKEKTIDSLLKKILALPGEKEIIVVDTEEKTTPVSLKGVRYGTAKKGRASQMNYGAEKARGDMLLFLHADILLPKNAFSVVEKTLQTYDAGGFSLRVDTKRTLLHFFAFMTTVRSKITNVPYGDQAIFVKKEVFQKVGGYDMVPFLEDVLFMEKIKKKTVLKEAVVTSPRHWMPHPWKQVLKNRCIMLGHFFGVPPTTLFTHFKK